MHAQLQHHARRFGSALLGAAILTAALAAPAAAQFGPLPRPEPRATGLPEVLTGVGIEQRLDERVPGDLVFLDHAGHAVRLGDLFGERPLLLALVYYDCPMLCHQVLHGVTRALDVLTLEAGRDFDVVTVSFDPSETPAQAARAREATLTRYGRGTGEGWHFLTGEDASVAALTDAVGFGYAYDEATGEWAHGAGIVLMTPEGRLARYFYGIEYSPRDLRFGLIEAAEGRIGSRIDQILLFCYQYDPAAGTYSLVVLNLVRIGGILTVLAFVTFVTVMLLRDRRRARESYVH